MKLTPTSGPRRTFTTERVVLVVLVFFLFGFLNVAYVARVLVVSSGPPSRTNDDSREETMPIVDPDKPEKPAFHVGMAMPARGAPRFRPKCTFLEPHHLEYRFIRSNTCYTRGEIMEIIRDLVIYGTQLFESHNITTFLMSGTLLGAYRHHDVIPHDVDGDLGMDQRGFERLQSQQLVYDTERYALDVWDSPYYENGGRDAKLSARLIHQASALYVDVFVFHDRVDPRTHRAMVGPVASDCFYNCVHCPHLPDGRKELVIPKEWIYPLQKCTFGGHLLQCPAKIEEYLTHEYGEHFMDPI